MRIALTEASYKHTIALARYLKIFDPSVHITAIAEHAPRFASLYKNIYDDMAVGDLSKILQKRSFDLVIPVGNASVKTLSERSFEKAVLPPKESLSIALSKLQTIKLGESLEVPVPKTELFQTCEEAARYSGPFPAVVKGSLEAGKNIVYYVNDLNELIHAFKQVLKEPSQKGSSPLVQERVEGVGLGLFAFYQQGEMKRFYMHQRLREFPLEGGSATAAMTIYHEKAFIEGKKLLDALKWNGPCMVEFKFEEKTGKLNLMEINPKFWGSLELGLLAGLNFGEYLIRSFRGEILDTLLDPSYPLLRFYWPFDGDLFGIVKARNLPALAGYFKKGYQTNIKTTGIPLGLLRFAADLKRKIL